MSLARRIEDVLSYASGVKPILLDCKRNTNINKNWPQWLASSTAPWCQLQNQAFLYASWAIPDFNCYSIFKYLSLMHRGREGCWRGYGRASYNMTSGLLFITNVYGSPMGSYTPAALKTNSPFVNTLALSESKMSIIDCHVNVAERALIWLLAFTPSILEILKVILCLWNFIYKK